jgi:hypothetical protein
MPGWLLDFSECWLLIQNSCLRIFKPSSAPWHSWYDLPLDKHDWMRTTSELLEGAFASTGGAYCKGLSYALLSLSPSSLLFCHHASPPLPIFLHRSIISITSFNPKPLSYAFVIKTQIFQTTSFSLAKNVGCRVAMLLNFICSLLDYHKVLLDKKS